MKEITLTSSIQELKGVGNVVVEKLNAKSIFCIADLLFVLPLRYEDKTKITTISDLLPGKSAQLIVTVLSANIRYSGKRSLHITAADLSGQISIRLFHFGKAQLASLVPGAKLLLYGQATVYKANYSITHPEYKILKNGTIPTLPEVLTPVYPSIGDVSGKRLVGWVAYAIKLMNQFSYEEFQPEFLLENNMMTLTEALSFIHQPNVEKGIINFESGEHPALRRLVFDEILSKQLAMIHQRDKVQSVPSLAIPIDEKAHQTFLSALPFTLTSAQQRAISDIFNDIQRPIPMQRMIQGDVGSGKTLVGFAACKQACMAGYQSVLMAPTEILAEQHFLGAKKFLTPHGLTVVRLTGKLKAKAKREALLKIADGQADVIIGTHALFQSDVDYHELGLVIIDEQHRFGVEQRLQLREKAKKHLPHLLVMTATPIPRTLAMSYYADFHNSIIDERPAGRQPIVTVLLALSKIEALSQRIAVLCSSGRQAYWVCALIGESEHINCAAAEARFEYLKVSLPDLKVGLLHGQMSGDEKATTMQRYSDGDIDLLVSTTVIEVGVDVPNSVLMVIENAERFGLAQLHQLRGRVGRGMYQSYCILLYQEPLSEIAVNRLSIIRDSEDGFEIANQDLRIRGAGEILGTRQTGEAQFKIANLERDAELFELGLHVANVLNTENRVMREEVLSRWKSLEKEFLNA